MGAEAAVDRRERTVRRAFAGDPILRYAALLGALYLVGFAVLNASTAGDSPAVQRAVDLLAVAALATPTLALTVAAVRWRRPGGVSSPWAWFALSTILTVSGATLSVGHDEAPGHPGLAGLGGAALLVAASIATAAGFLTAVQPGSRSARWWMGFDLVLAVAGIVALVSRFASTDGLPALASETRTTVLVYAVCGIATVVFLVPLAVQAGRGASPALRLVGAAYLVNALVDCGLLRTVLTGEHYEEGSWLSVGYQLGMVLLTLGALTAVRRDERLLIRLNHRRDRAMPLSVAAAGAAVGGLILMNTDLDDLHAPQVIAAVVVAGLLVRLWLVLRERTRLADRLGAALAEQQQLAVTDPLTGLPNRRHFESALTTEIVRARRSGRSLSLVILDLDHFKAINDVHGHPAGDAVLVAVAALFEQVTRGGDVVARYGGEEFVWLLPDTTEDGAAIMAERLRTTLEGHRIALPDGTSIPVTASIGIAADVPHAAALLHAADQALYRAKAEGRNRVCRASAALPDVTGPRVLAASR